MLFVQLLVTEDSLYASQVCLFLPHCLENIKDFYVQYNLIHYSLSLLQHDETYSHFFHVVSGVF